MSQKRFVLFLFLVIFLFSGGLLYFLDYTGVIRLADIFPFMAGKNPVRVEDREFPTEVEKAEFRKWEDKLLEREEALTKKEAELKGKEGEVDSRQREIRELQEGIAAERKKLAMLTKDWDDRQKKIRDLAEKVRNMPPEKAREMMQNWRDFDVIDVMRQMDKDAATEGTASITPYLLTLFTPERRAEITRKMLLPPLAPTEGELVSETN